MEGKLLRVTQQPPDAAPQLQGNPVEGILKFAAVFGGSLLVGWGIAALIEKVTEDPEHVAIKRSALRHVHRGAAVFADIAGWARPPVIGGCIPDVFAVYEDGSIAVEEFENERSVLSSHAERQHRAFSRWADRSPKRRTYVQIEVDGGRGGRR